MRILVLGGDGYLGWPTAMYLSARGHDVHVVDNYLRRRVHAEVGSDTLTPIAASLSARVSAWREVSGLTITSSEGDLTEWPVVERAFSDFSPETIIHYGQVPAAPYSMMDRHRSVFTQYNNVINTLNVLWAMHDMALDAHLVKLGTMGEYGTPNIDIEEGWLEITHNGRSDRLPFPKLPASLYHCSKVHDSTNIEFCCRAWDLRATDLNQGVVYGMETAETRLDPRLATRFDYDEVWGTALNRFCVQAVIGHPLTPYGTGGQSRGFLNIVDTLRCVELACLNPADPGEFRVFNQFTEGRALLQRPAHQAHPPRAGAAPAVGDPRREYVRSDQAAPGPGHHRPHPAEDNVARRRCQGRAEGAGAGQWLIAGTETTSRRDDRWARQVAVLRRCGPAWAGPRCTGSSGGGCSSAWKSFPMYTRTVPILEYHGVSGPPNSLTISRRLFVEQMTALKVGGFHPISMAQYVAFTRGDYRGLPTRPILLTFDDGRLDAYRSALSVLKGLGFHAVDIVVPGWVTSNHRFSQDYQEMTQLEASGQWDIEAHFGYGHEWVPVNKAGKLGGAFGDLEYFPGSKRKPGHLESFAHFQKRFASNMLWAVKELRAHVPGYQPLAMAIPRGDYGQGYTNDRRIPTFVISNHRPAGSSAAMRTATMISGVFLDRWACVVEATMCPRSN